MRLFSGLVSKWLPLLLLVRGSIAQDCVVTETGAVKSGFCFIDGACYSNGDARVTNGTTSVCQSCDSSESQILWSVTPGYSASTASPPNDCMEIPTDTYQSCSVPSFEWAVFDVETSSRFYGMRGAVTGNSLFAAGFVKSTRDGGDPGIGRVRGPYSREDPTGANAVESVVELNSYPASEGARENAGGSFGQYEVGVVKVDLSTGKPANFFVYGGSGMDQAAGLAARDDAFVVSGHFTGNLTVPLVNGSTATIHNSNYEEGEAPDNSMQFHPNTKDGAGNTGDDDGFVIRADAVSGKAHWIVRTPHSNRDAEIVDVDLDEEGNVYAAGYECSVSEGAEEGTPKSCDGVILKLAAVDGSEMWRNIFNDIGGVTRLVYNDGALYATGTTTYGGTSKDAKEHSYCDNTGDNTCATVFRADAMTGEVEWLRTVHGSPRLGIFDQTGKVEVAGDYLYVAMDDVGEDSGPVTLDKGTAYAGCVDNSGNSFLPEYKVDTTKTISAEDCPSDHPNFVERTSVNAAEASSAKSGAYCGGSNAVPACLMKYHKYTGLPMWGVDLPAISGIVPNGEHVAVAGWYYPGRDQPRFDDLVLPGYLRKGGLGSQTSGVYNALLSAEDGTGEYVVHSGGGSKDRLYDLVGDTDGNLYNVGYSMNLKTRWNGAEPLTTVMTEEDDGTATAVETQDEAIETHMYVAKLAAVARDIPSCLESCDSNTASASVKEGSCFIDGVCYAAGETATTFGKGPCFKCDPSVSQREWTEDSDVVGTTHCYVDDICVENGTFAWSQRRTWAPKTFSVCMGCDAPSNKYEWSLVTEGYEYTGTAAPPRDCKEVVETTAPMKNPSFAPTKDPTIAPTKSPTKKSTLAPTKAPVKAPVTTESPVATKKDQGEETSSASSNHGNSFSNVSLLGSVFLGVVFVGMW